MFSYDYARATAADFIKEIQEYCTKLAVVGSLRRKMKLVNDVDIMCIPRFEEVKDDTLFGGPIKINLLDRKLAQLCIENRMKPNVNGSKIKRFLQFDGSDAPIDIYICDLSTWITTFLIRTGSKEHNVKLCMRARELGMQLRAGGEGLFDAQLRQIKVETEQDIFKILKLPYLQPEERN